MLYVGHFSFDAPKPETTIEGGMFTCLVEADSLDAAAVKFQDLIISLSDSSDVFERVGNVFVEAIIEVKKLPEEGILAYYEGRTDLEGGTVSTTLPNVSEEFAVAYEVGPELTEEEEGDGYTPEPFVYHKEG